MGLSVLSLVLLPPGIAAQTSAQASAQASAQTAPPAAAPSAAKERVFRNSEVTADGLVDTLDIGAAASSSAEGAQMRGFKPAQAAGSPPRPGQTSAAPAAPAPTSAAGHAGSGKAPLMVTFHTGSAELTPDSMAVMGKVAQALQSDRLAGFAFRVEGHADPRGGDELNQRLSLARAEAVMKHLVAQHGVLQERLSAVGKGSTELYDKTRTEAPENRRVTIVTLRP